MFRTTVGVKTLELIQFSLQVPKTDLTTIQDDVESITNHWKQFKSAERVSRLRLTAILFQSR